MKHALAMLLLTLTITLQSGITHTYENAQVYEGQEKVEVSRHAFAVWPDAPIAEAEWKITGWEQVDRQQYLVVFDKDTNIALGIYPRSEVAIVTEI